MRYEAVMCFVIHRAKIRQYSRCFLPPIFTIRYFSSGLSTRIREGVNIRALGPFICAGRSLKLKVKSVKRGILSILSRTHPNRFIAIFHGERSHQFKRGYHRHPSFTLNSSLSDRYRSSHCHDPYFGR